METLSAQSSTGTVIDADSIGWQFICTGYVKGDHKGRRGFGKTSGAKTVEDCKAFCSAHTLCNAITFVADNNVCWMEQIPDKPDPDLCKHSSSTLSFWFGKGGVPQSALVEAWEPVCDGYVKGNQPGRRGFGKAQDAKTLEECKAACDAHHMCNSITKDRRTCWMEYMSLKPAAKDCQGDAQSFWRGLVPGEPTTTTSTQEPEEVDEDNDPLDPFVDPTSTGPSTGTADPSCSESQLRFGDKGCFYKCQSDLQLPMVESSKKGLALDDTTLHWCPQNAHFHWPNTNEPVKSFRMFKAWAPWWNEPWLNKEKAWESLGQHLRANNGKVLVGTQISCKEEDDDADWENVKQMIQIFGPDAIMGLAIGNELELLWTKSSVYNDTLDDCLQRMWNEEYFLKKFHDRVKDFDALGVRFSSIPVTSVFGGFILAEPGLPFYESKDKNIARIGTFVTNVTATYGERYVHTVNIYPYFEERFVEYDDSSSPPRCELALAKAVCFETDDPNQCLFTWMIGRMRRRLHALGNASSTLWIGETGWSHPQAHTMSTKMSKCSQWSTPNSKAHFYKNFLKWDLSMNSKYRGPDHIFYFAMRDSTNFGLPEGFGLVGDGEPSAWCTNTTCKLQKSSFAVETDSEINLVRRDDHLERKDDDFEHEENVDLEKEQSDDLEEEQNDDVMEEQDDNQMEE
jgi:hypothetical protein